MAILAGMPPVGVPEDATDLDGLPADVETVGTPAKPSLEKIVALEPTLVLITAEVPTQKELESSLDSAGIAWRDVDVNNFDDYATHMAALTEMSGRDDLYQANVTDVSDAIAKVEESAADLPQVSYLALLVSSTKAKVAKSDYFACEIFDNLQMANVDEDDSSLDDLSVEAIVAADPTYVFVIPRGDEDKAKEVFEQDFQAQPAWASLSAVQAGRINVLPKDLLSTSPTSAGQRRTPTSSTSESKRGSHMAHGREGTSERSRWVCVLGAVALVLVALASLLAGTAALGTRVCLIAS